MTIYISIPSSLIPATCIVLSFASCMLCIPLVLSWSRPELESTCRKDREVEIPFILKFAFQIPPPQVPPSPIHQVLCSQIWSKTSNLTIGPLINHSFDISLIANGSSKGLLLADLSSESLAWSRVRGRSDSQHPQWKTPIGLVRKNLVRIICADQLTVSCTTLALHLQGERCVYHESTGSGRKV